jgi:hypothetical protein
MALEDASQAARDARLVDLKSFGYLMETQPIGFAFDLNIDRR